MDGRFDVQSAPGKGTVARLVLPITASVIDQPASTEVLLANGKNVQSRSSQEVSGSASKVLLLIVDDHAMVRQGLCGLLEAYEDIQVIGEASTGKEAVELAHQLQPDIILMDVTMPDIDGIEVTKCIKSQYPGYWLSECRFIAQNRLKRR